MSGLAASGEASADHGAATSASPLLPVRLVEKPWGRDVLPAPFIAPLGKRIGEIWFEPPAALESLLVKYIFTSESLSVQVHPSDVQTQAAGLGQQGKEECWLVLDAEPGACLGIGFDQDLDANSLRKAALDGSIEQMLTWHKVVAGDFFYIPANTVHAIGAGISLIEVQQNSDITYRLYDYGRPRELHLDAGLRVARGEPYDKSLHQRLSADQAAGTVQRLVDGPYFVLDRVAGVPAAVAGFAQAGASYSAGPLLVIPLVGTVYIGGSPVAPGGCALALPIGSGMAEIAFAQGGLCLLAQPAIGQNTQ